MCLPDTPSVRHYTVLRKGSVPVSCKLGRDHYPSSHDLSGVKGPEEPEKVDDTRGRGSPVTVPVDEGDFFGGGLVQDSVC